MILSFSTLYEIFLSQIDYTETCWLWKGFSFELKNGEIKSSDIFVCHHCDNPPCVRPCHLSEGNIGDNNRDRLTKGRYSFKLNNSEVKAIRWLYAHGMNKQQLSEMFEVRRYTIYSITNGLTRTHLPEKDPIQNVGSS